MNGLQMVVEAWGPGWVWAAGCVVTMLFLVLLTVRIDNCAASKDTDLDRRK